jgi:DNA-binding NtrC family response regulator
VLEPNLYAATTLMNHHAENKTMTSGTASGRQRVVIVDRNLDFGLELADCLASSGYHAVLGRSLDAMLKDLREMQPGAILLSSDPSDQEREDSGAETLQTVKALCPHVPVITLMKPAQDHRAEFRALRGNGISRSEAPQVNRMEELLRGKLGVSCSRML